MVDRTPGKNTQKYPRLIWITILYITACSAAFGQVKAFASLKPESAETGDTISLVVIVSGGASEPKEVDFVAWSDVFPASNILARSTWRRSGNQWIRQYTLIAFDSARLELPPLAVLQSTGKPLITNALSLNIYPTGGDDISDMAPLRDIYREPVAWTDYWPWGAGALAMLILIVVWIRKANRRPKPVIVPAAVSAPVVTARETALKKLQELESQQLWKKGAVKEHHAALSLILREYLESNYGIAALESTTSEIMSLITATDLTANQIPLLRTLLLQADMVKYAQAQPPEATHEAVLEKARELIAPSYVKKPPATPDKPPPRKPSTGRYEPL